MDLLDVLLTGRSLCVFTDFVHRELSNAMLYLTLTTKMFLNFV